MVSQSTSLFTLGHSSRPLDEFLGLLSEFRIECLVDVRRLPGSRSFPQYNADALAGTLAMQGIDYWHLPALCGRRTKAELGGQPPEDFWTNASFARYAAYAHNAAFSHGLDTLILRARHQRCCLMCAEAVWWRCHRRIITDHLLARGVSVFHIMDSGKVVTARLTPGAHLHGNTVIYPPPSGSGHAPAQAQATVPGSIT